MAGEEVDEAPEQPTEKKGGGMIKMVIFAVVIIGCAGAACAVVFLVLIPMLGPPDSEEELEAILGAEPEGNQVIYNVGAIIANIDHGGIDRYLQIDPQLTLASPELKTRLGNDDDPILSQVKHTLILLLSDKRFDQLQSAEAKQRLSKEMVDKINAELGYEAVVAVRFNSFAIQ